MAKDAYDSFEKNHVVLAAAESLMERLANENITLKREVDDLKTLTTRLQAGHNELEN